MGMDLYTWSGKSAHTDAYIYSFMWKQNVYDLRKHTGQINTHYLDALLMRTAIDHFFYEEQSREFWLNLWASSHKYTFFCSWISFRRGCDVKGK